MLVVANETVLGEPPLDRIRARAKEGPASFLIVCPQSDSSRGEHPEAERRLREALSILRSEGLEVTRPDRPPGSLHGRDGGDRGRADGRGHRLHVPASAPAGSGATSSGGSVASGLPIQHVVVDVLPTEVTA